LENDFIVCVFDAGGDWCTRECIASFLPISSDVRFCTTSDRDSDVVIEMRKTKRDIPTLFFDCYESMVYTMAAKNRWVMFVGSNEVFHHECYSFMWNLMEYLDDWHGMMMTVFDASTGESSEELRLLSPRMMRGEFFDGKCFTAPPSMSVIRSHCLPRPMWKLSNGSIVGHDHPAALRHMVGRTVYSDVYIRKQFYDEL